MARQRAWHRPWTLAHTVLYSTCLHPSSCGVSDASNPDTEIHQVLPYLTLRTAKAARYRNHCSSKVARIPHCICLTYLLDRKNHGFWTPKLSLLPPDRGTVQQLTLTKRHRSAMMRWARQSHYLIENGLVAVVGRSVHVHPVRSTHARLCLSGWPLHANHFPGREASMMLRADIGATTSSHVPTIARGRHYGNVQGTDCYSFTVLRTLPPKVDSLTLVIAPAATSAPPRLICQTVS